MQTLGILAIVGAVGGVALLLAHLTPAGRGALGRLFAGQSRELVGWAGGVALVAMAGSLYLSEVIGFTPCVLCWYQRIAMYPLVVVGAVGWFSRDAGAWKIGLPLALIGAGIALYHVILQFQPALDVVSCDAGAPCTARYVLLFGFISIPGLALGAFLAITGLLATAGTLLRANGATAGD
ncbi:MAG: disulfide bond formation protein B [Gemmatimonadetes bacterium]|nr:disulfide bond formation protein B [Gemmatimonadota bacterium]